MNKRIITNVTSSIDFLDGLPNTFTVIIDDDLRDRIKQLTEAVKTLDVTSITTSFLEGIWSSDEFDYYGEPRPSVTSMTKPLEASPVRVESPSLIVTDCQFYFTCTPCPDGDATFSTPLINISEIENGQLFIDVPWFDIDYFIKD